MQKKRSAGFNSGLSKEKPLGKQAITKIRSSAKVTATYDEKMNKKVG